MTRMNDSQAHSFSEGFTEIGAVPVEALYKESSKNISTHSQPSYFFVSFFFKGYFYLERTHLKA